MNEDLKKSCFNFIYRRADDETVIYNTFSKAIVVLDNDEYLSYQNESLSEQLQQDLKECGILVERNFDEQAFLKYFHYKTKFSNKILYLTIAPTLDCNFACPYCYENRRKGKMSPEVQEAVCGYVEEMVEDGTEVIDISWYGGEPLLYFDVVETLSERIAEICRNHGSVLKMHMVTNGYLLTEYIVRRLDELGVNRIQITIDGTAENHDLTRPLRGGGGTFDRIFSNLSLFDDSPIAVVIRMNVDNRNQKDYQTVRKMIEELDNPNISLYASPVEDINKDRDNTVSEFMTTDQFEEFTVHTCDEGGSTSNDFAVMDNRYCFCTAETEYCYVVDDRGDFYKCWDEVGRPQYRCFNILDRENADYSHIASFVAADPFADEKCRNCVFLPLCFGGCKFQRAHLSKSVCGFTEQTLQKYLETMYFREHS